MNYYIGWRQKTHFSGMHSVVQLIRSSLDLTLLDWWKKGFHYVSQSPIQSCQIREAGWKDAFWEYRNRAQVFSHPLPSVLYILTTHAVFWLWYLHRAIDFISYFSRCSCAKNTCESHWTFNISMLLIWVPSAPTWLSLILHSEIHAEA